MSKCGQIHVYPGDDGMGVEVPCKNEARFEIGEGRNWIVCAECLAGLQEEDVVAPLKVHALEAAQ